MWRRRDSDIKVPPVLGHDCDLPREDEIIFFYIDDGLFVNFRRKFRRFLMVSPSHPYSKRILKSSNKIRYEEIRHLEYYYYLIHPFSQFSLYRQYINTIVYLLLLIVMPIEPIFLEITKMAAYIYPRFLMDLWALTDIGLSFITGYCDMDKQHVVMRPSRIINSYIFSYFLTDLASAVPVNMIIMWSQKRGLNRLRYIYIFKLFRLKQFLKSFKFLLLRIGVVTYKVKTCHFVLLYIIVIWWATTANHINTFVETSFEFFVFGQQNHTFSLLESGYQTVRVFLLVGVSENINESSSLDLGFMLVFLLVGSILNMVILVRIYQLYNQSSFHKKYDNFMLPMNEYMKYKELPLETKKRIFSYVTFKFQKNILKDSDILGTLSQKLRDDVLLNTNKNLVEKVKIFKEMPTHVILSILKMLRSEIYNANDVIFHSGSAGRSMYFLHIGTIVCYTSNNIELCHLENGAYFGEISLLFNQPRVTTCIALTICEVFRLSRKDYYQAIQPFPDISNKIRKHALAKLDAITKITHEGTAAPDQLTSILFRS